MTMQRIAEALGVSKKTISKDLDGIVTEGNNQKRTKSAANPRGAGRPKGSKRSGPQL
jgi:predicted ArsR family transcriptional regulator